MILKDTGTGTAYVASVFSVSHHAKFFLYLTFTCLTTSVKRTEKLILNVRRFYNPNRSSENHGSVGCPVINKSQQGYFVPVLAISDSQKHS